MILITFRWSLPSIKIQHEFGHKSYQRLLAINLIFMTVFITQSNSKLTQFLHDYVYGVGVETLPQYKEQIKLIKSKARVQAYKEVEQDIDILKRGRDRYCHDYIDLQSKVNKLKNLAYQVRNIKAMSDEELKNI